MFWKKKDKTKEESTNPFDTSSVASSPAPSYSSTPSAAPSYSSAPPSDYGRTNSNRDELFAGARNNNYNQDAYSSSRLGQNNREQLYDEEQDEEVEVAGLKQKIKNVKQDSLASTRAALQRLHETEATAANTMNMLGEQSSKFKLVVMERLESGNAIVNRLTFDSKDKLLVVGFAKAKACIVLEWKEDAFSYKDTLVTRLPILDIAFDLEQKLWISVDPNNNDDNDLISVFRLKDSKFEAAESNDGLVKQVNVTPVTRVKVMPDLYTIFGLRKFLDLPENMDGEEGKGSKKRKTE
ncbi:hypothetical protein RMATCC62417_11848 [Rhizopus microsporus]|nr:hypothetical protein RMATCC62417_11848 [Rhizopus microsporus]